MSKQIMSKRPVCLTIGGSDSCAGAGIQADLRIFEAFYVKGCSVMTALTAQNPNEIIRIEPASLAQVDAELRAIFDYYDVAVVKTGMLVDAEHIAIISAFLDQFHAGKPLIIDPVMMATSGRSLLDSGAIQTLKATLIPQATLVTPNLDEAGVLLGHTVDDLRVDINDLTSTLQCAVLLKGGHATSDSLVDILCEKNGNITPFTHVKRPLSSIQAHGTGCRLASAISACMASGSNLVDSVDMAIKHLQGDL